MSIEEPWQQLANDILRARDDPRKRGYLADIRLGISEFGELRAYPWVLPYSQNNKEQKALLRAASLIAIFKEIKQYEKEEGQPFIPPLGKLIRFSVLKQAASTNKDNDPIGPRLKALPSLGLDESIYVWRSILSIISKTPDPQIDWFALTRLFLHWGDGFSEASRNARMKVVRDYFATNTLPKSSNTTTENAN